MLAATGAAVCLSPLIAAGAVVYDAIGLRIRLPKLRSFLFILQYMVNDTVEIFLAPLYWALGGFGTRLDSPASIGRHEQLQRWSIEVLARRADRLLGVTVDIDSDSVAALEPAPTIVCCRHVNLLDASLPSFLYQSRGIRVRGVIMAEMLSDPGFDLLYGRLGSVFIPRDNGPEARRAATRLASELDKHTVAVIFPEGRLFRPELLERSLAKLATSDPQRAERLSGLRHVLPPRPGGVNALLDAAPAADVVVIAHAGLDAYPRFADLAGDVPLHQPVRVTAWRTRRADIPADPLERARWLDSQWQRVDDWVHTELAG
jgi:1-acyl-sn-glycerol-3-phosphate acyltransferase